MTHYTYCNIQWVDCEDSRPEVIKVCWRLDRVIN